MKEREKYLEYRLKIKDNLLKKSMLKYQTALQVWSYETGQKASVLSQQINEELNPYFIKQRLMPIPKPCIYDKETNEAIEIIIDAIWNTYMRDGVANQTFIWQEPKFNKRIVKQFFKNYGYEIKFKGSIIYIKE